jgi:hypothetical protein
LINGRNQVHNRFVGRKGHGRGRGVTGGDRHYNFTAKAFGTVHVALCEQLVSDGVWKITGAVGSAVFDKRFSALNATFIVVKEFMFSV